MFCQFNIFNEKLYCMNSFRFSFLLFLGVFAQGQTFAQSVGVLHLNPLHLELPATWIFDGSKNPIEGKGPNGEVLLISVLRRQAGPSESALKVAEGFSGEEMADLASRRGKVVIRPVGKFPAPTGKVGYSAGSEVSDTDGGKSYFIQYLLAEPNVMIYFTFEGKDEALPAMQRFDALIRTQHWDE
jgi:hypothetical protein